MILLVSKICDKGMYLLGKHTLHDSIFVDNFLLNIPLGPHSKCKCLWSSSMLFIHEQILLKTRVENPFVIYIKFTWLRYLLAKYLLSRMNFLMLIWKQVIYLVLVFDNTLSNLKNPTIAWCSEVICMTSFVVYCMFVQYTTLFIADLYCMSFRSFLSVYILKEKRLSSRGLYFPDMSFIFQYYVVITRLLKRCISTFNI